MRKITELFKGMLGTIPDAQIPTPEYDFTFTSGALEHLAAIKDRNAAQLADPSTMTPDHPDYMRMVVHSLD